nr:MAG TPA: hypothetical protein [Caudoviricetes sp.]
MLPGKKCNKRSFAYSEVWKSFWFPSTTIKMALRTHI